MLDEGGVRKAVALAQRAVRIENLHHGFLKLLHQLFGQDVLYDGKAVSFYTFIHGIQFIDAELIAIVKFRLFNMTVVHGKLLANTLVDLSLQGPDCDSLNHLALHK